MIDRTPPAHRPLTFVDDVIVPWSDFMYAHADESMPNVLARAQQLGKDHALVYDSLGRQVGYLPLAATLMPV